MGHISCPLCNVGNISSIVQFQHRIASVLSHLITCPICGDQIGGLVALQSHLQQHNKFISAKVPSPAKQTLPPTDDIGASLSFENSNSPLDLLLDNCSTSTSFLDSTAPSSLEFLPSLNKLEINDNCQSNNISILNQNKLMSSYTDPNCSLQSGNSKNQNKLILYTDPNCSLISDKSKNQTNQNKLISSYIDPNCSLQSGNSKNQTISQPSPIRLDCDQCGLLFSNAHFLQLHKDIIHKSNCTTCTICNDKFDDVELFRAHMQNDHEKHNYFCNECPKVFKLKGSLIVHQRMFHSGSPCKCSNCGKKFPTIPRRDFHHKQCQVFKRKNPNTNQVISPSAVECIRKSMSDSSSTDFILVNDKISTLIDEKKLQNPSVSMNSSQNRAFYFPATASKVEDKSEIAHYESFNSTNLDGMETNPALPIPLLNEPSMTEGNEPAFILPFRERGEVEEDVPSPIPQAIENCRAKQQEKIWGCDVCKKSFTTKYFLKKHKRLHTGETPYCCAECGKAFTFQQTYHKHLQYHTDEKPHACPHCGRSFKELSTLNNHIRIHTGEKPFKCPTCGKAFRQRVSYLVHMRIHTGEMPYLCQKCGRSFRYKVSLKSHKCVAVSPRGIYQPDEVDAGLPLDEIEGGAITVTVNGGAPLQGDMALQTTMPRGEMNLQTAMPRAEMNLQSQRAEMNLQTTMPRAEMNLQSQMPPLLKANLPSLVGTGEMNLQSLTGTTQIVTGFPGNTQGLGSTNQKLTPNQIRNQLLLGFSNIIQHPGSFNQNSFANENINRPINIHVPNEFSNLSTLTGESNTEFYNISQPSVEMEQHSSKVFTVREENSACDFDPESFFKSLVS